MFLRLSNVKNDEAALSDYDDALTKELRLDKIALAIIISTLTAFGAMLWSMRSEISALELKNAELRGAQTAMISTLADLQAKGSATAQRTEILVIGLQDRFSKLEDFMAKGSRFTAADGEKLERRMEKIEIDIENHLRSKGK